MVSFRRLVLVSMMMMSSDFIASTSYAFGPDDEKHTAPSVANGEGEFTVKRGNSKLRGQLERKLKPSESNPDSSKRSKSRSSKSGKPKSSKKAKKCSKSKKGGKKDNDDNDDVCDEELSEVTLLQRLDAFPFQVHQRAFGSEPDSETPLYEVAEWDPANPSVDVELEIKLDNGSTSIMTVVEVTESTQDFIDYARGVNIPEEELDLLLSDSLSIDYVFATIGDLSLEVMGMMVTINEEEETGESVTLFIVLREAALQGFSDFGFGSELSFDAPEDAIPARSLLSDVDETKAEKEPNPPQSSGIQLQSIERRSQAIIDGCREVLFGVLEQLQCPDPNAPFATFDPICLRNALQSFAEIGEVTSDFETYQTSINEAEATRDAALIQLARDFRVRVPLNYIQRIRVRNCPPGGCCNPSCTRRIRIRRERLREGTIEWAEATLRNTLNPEETERRRQIEEVYQEALNSARALYEGTSNTQCQSLLEGQVSACSTCDGQCEVDGQFIQCCSNSDCASGSTCLSGTCIATGLVRFSLSWSGEDDLDVHVITPDGCQLYYANPICDGGFLDQDDIPQEFGVWVENIVFNEPSPGTYGVFVNPFNVKGSGPDAWELDIFVANRLVASYSGIAVGRSPTYQIVVDPADLEGGGECQPPGGLGSVDPELVQDLTSCVSSVDDFELDWQDVIVEFDDLLGGTSKVQRVIYVDTDLIPKVRAYDNDPYWWQYYRSFWNEDGTEFTESGKQFEQGELGRDCRGLEWYTKDTVEVDSPSDVELFSTRYCTPISKKGSNNYCGVFLQNHYRGRIQEYIPGLFTLGPTYKNERSTLAGVAMNFKIFLDEYVPLTEESFECYKSGYWREVIPGEVTPDGWAIVPQASSPQWTSETPYFQWLFIVPKGKSVRVGRCPPTAVYCTETARNVGDALILDPPLSQISDEERERREQEKFLRLLEERYALGSLYEGVKGSRMRRSDKAKEGFYVQWKDENGKWQSNQDPIPITQVGAVLAYLKVCSCLTINGSGNRWEAGLQSGYLMADEAGREFNFHYYMPVSAGPISYTLDNFNSDLPEILGALTNYAFDNGIELDLRGHSWSGWMLWRACAEQSTNNCRGMQLTTYAPAAMPQNWLTIRNSIANFEGDGRLVYGVWDPLSLPTLGPAALTGAYSNPNVDATVLNTSHGLQGILDTCDNCRLLGENIIHVSPLYRNT